MKKKSLSIPEKKHWRTTWSERQVKLLHSIALGNIQKGFPNMVSAWKAAETHLSNRKNLQEARQNAQNES